MTYKLTICIPTYNREIYIASTLQKILDQNFNGLQVVISDNASNDNTESIVAEFNKKGLAIKYFRWPINMGADKNYLKAADLADGEYIWFLGSDDWIIPGAVDVVVSKCESLCSDIYLCSEYLCDIEMRPYGVHYLLGDNIPDTTFKFPSDDQFLKYFNLAQSHSALFGYLSSIIVKRERWSSVVYDPKYDGTLYSHMYILYMIVFGGATLHYISMPLVMWRSGNDSFGGKGRITERYLADMIGFKMIIDDFFKFEPQITKAFVGAFRRHHPYKNIAFLRMHTPSRKIWNDISRRLSNDYGYDQRMLNLLSHTLAPILLKFLFIFYRIQLNVKRLWYRFFPKIKIRELV
jgi:abequosyltransferase